MRSEESRSWGASETFVRIRDGEVSRREVLDAAIERARAAKDLGAIVTEIFDRPIEGSRNGPFSGVPTFIKDLVEVQGVRTRWGTRASGSYVSTRTDKTAARLLQTGLVCLGKSATPELGLTATTEPIGFDP